MSTCSCRTHVPDATPSRSSPTRPSPSTSSRHGHPAVTVVAGAAPWSPRTASTSRRPPPNEPRGAHRVGRAPPHHRGDTNRAAPRRHPYRRAPAHHPGAVGRPARRRRDPARLDHMAAGRDPRIPERGGRRRGGPTGRGPGAARLAAAPGAGEPRRPRRRSVRRAAGVRPRRHPRRGRAARRRRRRPPLDVPRPGRTGRAHRHGIPCAWSALGCCVRRGPRARRGHRARAARRHHGRRPVRPAPRVGTARSRAGGPGLRAARRPHRRRGRDHREPHPADPVPGVRGRPGRARGAGRPPDRHLPDRGGVRGGHRTGRPRPARVGVAGLPAPAAHPRGPGRQYPRAA